MRTSVARVEVDTQGDGRAMVRWEVEGGPIAVDVATTFDRLIEAGMGPEAAAGILSAPRWAMEQALADLDRRYGDVEAYLTGPAGMAPTTLGALRDRLVDP